MGGVWDGVGVLARLGGSLIVEYNSSSTGFSETETSPNASEYTGTLASPPPPPLVLFRFFGTGGRGIFPRPFTATDDFLFSERECRDRVGAGAAAVPPLPTETEGDKTPFCGTTSGSSGVTGVSRRGLEVTPPEYNLGGLGLGNFARGWVGRGGEVSSTPEFVVSELPVVVW